MDKEYKIRDLGKVIWFGELEVSINLQKDITSQDIQEAYAKLNQALKEKYPKLQDKHIEQTERMISVLQTGDYIPYKDIEPEPEMPKASVDHGIDSIFMHQYEVWNFKEDFYLEELSRKQAGTKLNANVRDCYLYSPFKILEGSIDELNDLIPEYLEAGWEIYGDIAHLKNKARVTMVSDHESLLS